jgi:hypothetical protein
MMLDGRLLIPGGVEPPLQDEDDGDRVQQEEIAVPLACSRARRARLTPLRGRDRVTVGKAGQRPGLLRGTSCHADCSTTLEDYESERTFRSSSIKT